MQTNRNREKCIKLINANQNQNITIEDHAGALVKNSAI